MPFAERVARQQEAVFRTFGEDAEWEGVSGTVRVRRREADEEMRFERGEIVAMGRQIRVRQSDVAEPAEGQTVQILDDDGNPLAGELYEVAGEPQLDRKAVWRCPIRPAS